MALLASTWSAPDKLHDKISAESSARVVSPLNTSSVPVLTAALLEKGWRKVVLITSDSRRMLSSQRFVRSFLDLYGLSGVSIVTLPEISRTPFETLPIHTHVQIDRAEALARLYGDASTVVITPASALRWGLTGQEQFQNASVMLQRGETLQTEKMAEKLVRAGYVRRDLVGEAGEFAIRGYIIDVFSPAHGLPVRIELYGDSIDSLRSFNPSTQRSMQQINEYSIIPLRSIPFSESDEAELRARLVKSTEIESDEREEKLQQLHQAEEAPWMWRDDICKRYLVNLEAALPPETLVVFEDYEKLIAALETQHDTWRNQSLDIKGKIGGIIAESLGKKNSLAGLENHANLKSSILDMSSSVTEQKSESGRTGNVGFSFLFAGSESAEPFARFLEEVDAIGETKSRALVVLQSEGHLKRVADQLIDRGIRVLSVNDSAHPPQDVLDSLFQKSSGSVVLVKGEIEQGFYLQEAGLKVFSHSDVFGKSKRSRVRRKSTASAFAVPVHELKEGSYIVHEDHGVGKFHGLRTIRRGSEIQDFIQLSYAGGDRLLIPVDNMDRIQKYSALEGVKPRLDKLGGANWHKVKQKARKAIRQMAGELISLYAIRRTITGFAHIRDNELTREFEESFPFQETADQLDTMEEIKQDMESGRPMDRLVCGDVGYGKTELAIRAAVKAAVGGKQTAFLAPTTILAQQHYETVADRLQGFPFKVEMLSRFRTPAAQKKIIDQVKEGAIDVLVGTHRILSKDVVFKNLGLLVIDEEQRFGVAHKERIKQIRKQVDVLALTATPIPRTLNMSLAGIRDMSLIQTPPKNRLAIQTKVLPYSRETIRDAISKELARDGQVFYLRNRIEDIERIAAMIRELVHDAKPAVAHAQMSSNMLEQVMSEFVKGTYNVLVSTTIIENGLDIPKANTLIVERADRFGLAQLYQIRGRVGRSDRSAFAYLLVPVSQSMTSDARRRLQAIREFSDLGSGFRIAAMDLEIRGAGNLLGGEQSGHIEAIGYDLYNRMLERTIHELKGESVQQPVETTFNMGMDLHIPDSYISDTGYKMKYYRRVMDARSELELENLNAEIADLFGTVPESVTALFRFSAIRMLAAELGLQKLEKREQKVSIKFAATSEVNPQVLADLVHSGSSQFSAAGILTSILQETESVAMLDEIYRLLHSLKH